MSPENDLDRFVKDPSLLVALCTEVVERLDPFSDESGVDQREAQLREISKAIDRLEKAAVAIPDVLRTEKIRLATSIAIHTDATQVLVQLADELQNIVTDLRERLGQNASPTDQKSKRRRSNVLKTEKTMLRQHIVQALKTLGGRARVTEVIEQMGRQLGGQFLPGDMEWRESAQEYVWQNNAKWERFQMTQDGSLRSGSPRGIWELGENEQ